MRAKVLPAVAGLFLLAAAAPALAPGKPAVAEPDDGPDPRGLTISGIGLARVETPGRLTETSIGRAVAAAQPAANARAVRHARRRARALARAAGLTLGSIEAVRVRLPTAETNGPARYCYRRCRAPRFATASIRVTFATAETSSVVATGRAVVASASATAPVRPERRTNPAIRAAMRRAQLASDPPALAAARRRSAGAARAAGLRRPALFSLAEEALPLYAQDVANGTFGPGLFCGKVRIGRYRLDPVTGERRWVRGRRVRRCYVPRVFSVMRVTYTAG